MKNFKILVPIKNENGGHVGDCEVIDQDKDISPVIEYRSKYGVFYTSEQRIRHYKKKKLILVK